MVNRVLLAEVGGGNSVKKGAVLGKNQFIPNPSIDSTLEPMADAGKPCGSEASRFDWGENEVAWCAGSGEGCSTCSLPISAIAWLPVQA